MAVLGIEGTAHTIGVGIVEEDAAGKCRILANERAMVRPPAPSRGEAAMGIHPREAAHHHAEVGPTILEKALAAAGLRPRELDGIAFSQGPGLGPCLRVAATMARSLAIASGKPLVGVNHCVAHLEVARGMTDATDPMLLYVSGANTQVLAYVRGRYRVFGETLDIGLGNALDKFAREHGTSFPGGPEVERLASAAPADAWHDLPYAVKGMDVSFAGLATAGTRLVTRGVPLVEVCHALQEHAFAALVETAERALAHTGKTELALGGGVACNARLQAMAKAMCDERGAAFHCPPRQVLVDNGAMIAWLGLAKLAVGDTVEPEASAVRPYERTDQVDVTWRAQGNTEHPGGTALAGGAIARGAEAVIVPGTFVGRPCLEKRRDAKGYRHPRLDAAIRGARTKDEANILAAARRAGVHVPVVFDLDRGAATLSMEAVAGQTLKGQLERDDDAAAEARMRELGRIVARLHAAGVTHGDLTTRNVLVPHQEDPASLVMLDFGLGALTEESEARGVDLHVVEEALEATEARAAILRDAFLSAYAAAGEGHGAAAALGRLEQIRQRGRYR